ncbi:MAG: DNA adenine methylase, partial [Trinickia sp.]|uniref:DNA adenine methylase n=1 Tax=Trinickia sp. TaxID=2571163 RepID=UPI003F7D169B
MANCTPLRYPGGKARLRPYLERLIAQNRLYDAHYVEPFCGGAGLALELLMSYTVSTIHINDLDRAVYAFWYSATKRTDALCAKISDTPCTIETWQEQRSVWMNRSKANLLDLGFATFFLNRTNRSGILDAGVIGGKNQNGQWKLDARYNRDDLIARIKAIGQFRSRIMVYNKEAIDFLQELQPSLPRK